MSKTEGIGEEPSIERIEPPTEAEVRSLYEEFEEVVTASSYGGERVHPVGEGGEPLCAKEEHNVNRWSNPKPIASYPIGPDGEPYRPICLYCIRNWRDDR